MAKSKTVDEYIRSFPEEIQARLHEVRKCIRAAAPEASESLKWGNPAYSDGTILVIFAAFKHHINLYSTPSSLEALASELTKFETGKGSIKFPYDKPLPTKLIWGVTAFRVWESKEKGVKWM